MRYVIFGNIGSDAGYWTFENGKFVHHGGWEIESIREVQQALTLIAEASKLRTPGLAERLTGVLDEFVGSELTEHVGKGQNVVVVVG